MESLTKHPDEDFSKWEDWDDVDKTDPMAVIRFALKDACRTIEGEYSVPSRVAVFEAGVAALAALRGLEKSIRAKAVQDCAEIAVKAAWTNRNTPWLGPEQNCMRVATQLYELLGSIEPEKMGTVRV